MYSSYTFTLCLCWALIALGIDSFPQWFDSGKHTLLENFGLLGHEEKMHLMEETLLHHLGKTAEILVFLLGAMTIVEIIDYFDGFVSDCKCSLLFHDISWWKFLLQPEKHVNLTENTTETRQVFKAFWTPREGTVLEARHLTCCKLGRKPGKGVH